MIDARRIERVVSEIDSHYRAHARSFPWRGTDDPYHILVSEYMLQQTGTDRVVPKYLAFIRRFPTVFRLARAHRRSVLSMWIGLGYNRRGVALHTAAGIIAGRYGGIVPRTEEELRSLPGVGGYTAAAVMAFAYDEPACVVETNIRTVVMHHCFPGDGVVDDAAIREYVVPMLAAAAERGMSPRTFYSACMDYGAHLKRTGVRMNARSARYAPQGAFSGSVRQARGRILRLCVDRREGVSPVGIRELGAARSDEALAGMVADGTLRYDGRAVLYIVITAMPPAAQHPYFCRWGAASVVPLPAGFHTVFRNAAGGEVPHTSSAAVVHSRPVSLPRRRLYGVRIPPQFIYRIDMTIGRFFVSAYSSR